MKLSPILLLAGALALGGCTWNNPITSAGVGVYDLVTGQTVSQGKAKALHDSIATLQKISNAYIETCIQPANQKLAECSKALVGQVGTYLGASRAADDNLYAAIVAAQAQHSNVKIASTLYNAASSAANALSKAKSAADAAKV